MHSCFIVHLPHDSFFDFLSLQYTAGYRRNGRFSITIVCCIGADSVDSADSTISVTRSWASCYCHTV